jgi:hypothetical protein
MNFRFNSLVTNIMILLNVAVNNLISSGRSQICWKTSAGRKKELRWDTFGSRAAGLTCLI